LDRDRRAADIQLWMQRYAERLEYYAHLAPYNWFNFYPFWIEAKKDTRMDTKNSAV